MSSPMSCRNAALPLPELPPSPSPEIHIEKPDSRPWSKSLDVSPMDPDSCPTALGPRKRRASSPNPGPPKAVHNFRSWKRSRLSVVLPPSFWDSLSEIPLTRNALRELDRRNFKAYRDFKRDHAHNPQRQQTKGGLPSNQSPAYLKQIRAFARHGGPDLRDMRGYPNPAEPSFCMSSSYTTLRRLKRGASQPTKSSQRIRDPKLTTQETKNTGPYDRAFQQHLIDNSILPFPYEYPDGHWPSEPENLGEIRQYLTRRRDSLSPSRFSEHDFRKFVIQDARAVKERLVAAHVFPMVRGDTEHPVYFSGDVPFNNLKPLTSVPLVAAQPDLYYGSRPEQLDLRVRRALGAHIIPSTQADLPLAPNFFVELKGPKGDLCVGDLQLSYDMAFGARGLQSLRAYGGGSPTDFKDAYTLGCFYISGTLTMFACHQIPPSTPGGSPGYAMTKVGAWAMSGDLETFVRGASAYRNGRDWAKRQRDDAIRAANERAAASASADATSPAKNSPELSLASQASVRETLATSQDTTQPTGANKHPTDELDTSADELSLPSPRPAKRRKSRAVRNQSLKREQKRDNRGNLS